MKATRYVINDSLPTILTKQKRVVYATGFMHRSYSLCCYCTQNKKRFQRIFNLHNEFLFYQNDPVVSFLHQDNHRKQLQTLPVNLVCIIHA